jgi:putative ABC transport system permease protein
MALPSRCLMRLTERIKVAFRTLYRNPLRTGLMVAGLVVGIAILTAANSVGESTRRETAKRVKNMLRSFDTVLIRPGASRTRGMVSVTNVPPTLKFEDAAAIARELSTVSRVALLQNAFDIDVKAGDRTDTTAVFGVSTEWQDIQGDQALNGRLLTAEDMASRARVALLGSDVAKGLFSDTNPIGQSVQLAGVPFVVVGTLASRGAGPGGASLDDLIVIPVTTAATRLFNRDYLTMLIAQLRDPDHADVAVADITALLRQRHHLAAEALDDFSLTSPKAVATRVSEATSTLTKLVWGSGLLLTALGAAMMTGIMLTGVSERRPEVGLRRAIGAARGDILSQFVLEAGGASFAGGIAGILLGALAAGLITRVQKLPLVVSGRFLLAALVIAIGIGVLTSLYPAWKAARVDPVRALRA